MKNLLKYFMIVLIITSVFNTQSYGQLKDLLKKAGNLITQKKTESNDPNIVDGLKEALSISSKNAVDIVSKENGYFGNELIKIPLPKEMQTAAKIGRQFGMGKQFDEFELSMNRAAESAATEATSIFWDAIKKMTFDDAKKILTGRDNEATLYFQEKTSDNLRAAFKPIIDKSMENVGVTKTYQNLLGSIKKIPLVKMDNTDLDEYVTNKALDGLFTMMAGEEKKIRTDPAARVTDLLKQVFGK
jgi:hypothetical protein